MDLLIDVCDFTGQGRWESPRSTSPMMFSNSIPWNRSKFDGDAVLEREARMLPVTDSLPPPTVLVKVDLQARPPVLSYGRGAYLLQLGGGTVGGAYSVRLLLAH